MQPGSIRRRIERWLVPSYHKFGEILRFSWTAVLGMYENNSETYVSEAAARSSFRKHNSYVKSMLENKTVTLPDGSKVPQLLVFDCNEGWEPLCKFLGVETPPDVPFPVESQVNVIPHGDVGSKHEDFVGKGKQRLTRRVSQVFSAAKERVITADFVQEWEDMLDEGTPFGQQLRVEMRRGLLYCSLALTAFAAVAGVVLSFSSQVPIIFVSLIYISLMLILWHTYAIMNTLVMRVPAVIVFSTAMQTFAIAASLHACFITYGILKETLVVQHKVASPVLILVSRLLSAILAALVLVAQGKKVRLGAPIQDFAAFALTNEGSTWAGYEMLKYVSFPVQVMAKSVKILPNMIMGRIVNGTQYSFGAYMQGVLALVCVVVMHLSEEDHEDPGEENSGDMSKHLMGLFFLVMFFVTDSFTSQWQTSLYAKHKRLSKVQMMLAGNLLAIVFTAFSMASRWTKVSQSLVYVMSNVDVLVRVLGLGLAGACGQFCIYSAIKMLGPLSFTWIMTARQLLSVLISLVFFGHGVSLMKIVCIFTVFGIMSWKQIKGAFAGLFDSKLGAVAKPEMEAKDKESKKKN